MRIHADEARRAAARASSMEGECCLCLEPMAGSVLAELNCGHRLLGLRKEKLAT
jgi:hypothetical protein